MLAFLFIVCLGLFICFVISVCGKSYREEIKEEIEKERKERLRQPASIGKEMTKEEVLEVVTNPIFWGTVNDFIKEGKFSGKPLEDSGYVEGIFPCEYHDCSAHVTRDDCCNSSITIDGKDYCKFYFNLNKLCGVGDENKSFPKDDPKLLTNEEVKMLGDILTRYEESKH